MRGMPQRGKADTDTTQDRHNENKNDSNLYEVNLPL
jgi:hypothetical protein